LIFGFPYIGNGLGRSACGRFMKRPYGWIFAICAKNPHLAADIEKSTDLSVLF